MKVKKNPSLSLEPWSSVFFLIGLVTMLSISFFALEWKSFETATYEDDSLLIGDDLTLDLPII
jgi:protein TonB